MKVYLIGSLRNPEIPSLGHRLRKLGVDVFDDWMAAGPEADDYWQKYEDNRERSYKEALAGAAAQHVFEFDYYHLTTSDACVLVLPTGKSGHIEFGFMCGLGKPSYILFDKTPERYDVMYKFATDVFFHEDELVKALTE
jgi:nucleoside 2-deoxyribosyltransferase